MLTLTRFLLAGVLATGALLAANAQNVPFSSERFLNKEALRTAQKALKNGELKYTAAPPRYAAALAQFEEAQRLNPNNAPLRSGEEHSDAEDGAQLQHRAEQYFLRRRPGQAAP